MLLFGNPDTVEEQWVKIADYGLNKYVYRNRYYKGSINYKAPELINHPNQYTSASDVWALCMTMTCLVLNEIPKETFRGESRQREIDYR